MFKKIVSIWMIVCVICSSVLYTNVNVFAGEYVPSYGDEYTRGSLVFGDEYVNIYAAQNLESHGRWIRSTSENTMAIVNGHHGSYRNTLKIVAKRNANVMIFCKVNHDKAIHLIETDEFMEGGYYNSIVSYSEFQERYTIYNCTFNAEAGKTYYFVGQGTDALIYSISTSASNYIAPSNSTSSEPPTINYVLIDYNGTKYNGFSDGLCINKGDTNTANIYFDVSKNGASDIKVALTQGASKNVSADGNYISGAQLGKIFSPDKPIYAVVYSKDSNKSSSRVTNIRIYKENDLDWTNLDGSGNKDLKFKIFRDTKVTIPGSVPVFGDMEIGLDLDFIPISIEVDNNKVKIVYGKKISQNTGTGKFKDFSYSKFKEDLKKAAANQGKTLKQLRDDHKMSVNKIFTLQNVSSDCDVMGYAECIITDEGKWVFSEGLFQFNAEVKFSRENTVFVGTFPIYYEFGGGFGAGFDGKLVNVDVNEGFTPKLQADITAKIEATIGGGVGVTKVATVGATGKGTLNAKWSLTSSYQKYDVTGKAEFKVKLFGKQVASKKFAEGYYLIYETGNPNGLISGLSANSLDDIDINTVYDNVTRAYAAKPSAWNGEYVPLNAFAVDYSAVSTRTLGTNVYPDTKPIIRNVDGTMVMVWLEDDKDRSDADRTVVVYSVYDNTEDTWSAPQAVDDDGTADFYPYFKNGWVVWQNSKGTIAEDATLADIGADAEVYAAKFNGSGFDSPVAITDNAVVDTLPVVSAEGDKVTVAWLRNSANDILMNSGTTSITVRSLTDGAWGEEYELYSGDVPVVCLDGTYYNGDFTVAYVTDADNDYDTVTDRELTVVTENGSTAVTDDESLDSNPIFSGDKLYWYSEGNVKYASIADLSNVSEISDDRISGLNDSFTVDTNSKGNTVLAWASGDGETAEIKAFILTDGEWSDGVTLTDEGKLADCPFVYLDDTGNVSAAYVSRADNEEDTQRDLCIMELKPSYDISVEDVYIDCEDVTARENTTAYITVLNNGQKQINGFSLAVYDTDGTLVNSSTYDTTLQAGASTVVELEYIPTGNETKGNIRVTATIDDDEADTDNNEFLVEYSGADISVEDVTNVELLPENHIVANIVNKGCEDVSNITVSLKEDSADGETLQTQTLDTLAAGASSTVTFDVEPMSLSFDDSVKALYVVAEAEDDTQAYNNDGYVAIYRYDRSEDYTSFISDQSFDTETNTLDLNTVVVNNLNEDVTLNNVVEVKNSNGELIKKAVTKIDMTPCLDIADDFSLVLPDGYSEDDITVEVYATTDECYTDVDCDGDFDKIDAELLLKAVGGITDKTDINYGFSDYNNDGVTDVRDVIYLLKLATDTITDTTTAD